MRSFFLLLQRRENVLDDFDVAPSPAQVRCGAVTFCQIGICSNDQSLRKSYARGRKVTRQVWSLSKVNKALSLPANESVIKTVKVY